MLPLRSSCVAVLVIVATVAVAVAVLGAEAKTEWDIGPHRYASVDVKFESGVNYTWADWGGPTCPPRLFLLRPHKNAKFPYFTKSLDSFDQYCAAYVKDWLTRFNATIGLSAIVVLGDQVVFSKGYGHTTMDPASPPPTEDSIFRIGSITKIFTSLMLMQAIERSVVNLDDPVTKFYNNNNRPAFSPPNPYSSDLSGVTLHSMAQHSSGLTRESPDLFNDWTEERIMMYVNKMPLLYPPYSTSRYSNLGIDFIGRCIQRAANITYEDWVQRMILDPIGMSSAGFSFPSDVVARMPVGYTIANGEQVVIPQYSWPLFWSAPAGAMRASPSDMAKFMRHIFAAQRTPDDSACSAAQPPKPGEKCVLSRSRWFEWMQGAALQRNGISGFGLGTFEQAYSNGYWVQTKGGLLAGFGSTMALVPELELGVFVVVNMNTGSISQASALAMNLMIPALVRDLTESQQAFPLPPNYSIFLGSYGGLFTLAEGGPNYPPGMLGGSFPLASMPRIALYWDSIQDVPAKRVQPAVTAFRYNNIAVPEESCFAFTESGTNGVAYFYQALGQTYVDLPDVSIFGLPKDP